MRKNLTGYGIIRENCEYATVLNANFVMKILLFTCSNLNFAQECLARILFDIIIWQ